MRYLPHVLTLCIALGIAWGTLTPMPPPTAPPDGTDKIQHFAAFALLVLPLGWVDIRNALWLAPVALLYGGAI